MLDAYRRDCITLGKDVVIVRGDERRYATAQDIAGDGALIVTYADGTREAVSSGEVSVRGMYGYV
jgi:BirA family biotin operon repressor/biotin-[acetyl-CoA-carboxylase] ligase